MPALLSIPIASYCSIERLALICFSGAQQDHKLNETGITSKAIRLVKVRSIEEVYFVGIELLRENTVRAGFIS